MGITGLLPFLKKASKQTHARNFSGYTAAVDGHGWLHKGAFGCAVKLGMGEATDAYVSYFMKYVNCLVENNIKPLIVFDGRSLPAKEGTNEKRRKTRTESRKKAQDLMRKGDKKGAWEYFVKSIHITHEMVHDVIKVLRQKHIDYIVAPYEADGQLAYLAINGYVDLVITEDSDLVLFGCPKILFKLKMTGECVVFDNSKIHLSMEVTAAKFQFERFRQMCILSGCDYLESLPGIGLTRAKKIINAMTSPDIDKAIKQIPTTLKLDIEVPEEYISNFHEAEHSFLHQLVFDPKEKRIRPLHDYNVLSPQPDELPLCGKNDLKVEEWVCLASGSLHTRTMKKVDNYDISKDKGYLNRDSSIWAKKYKKSPIENSGNSKNDNKHSSTKGLHVTASVKTVATKKRPIASDEGKKPASDPTDKELLALYATDSNDQENSNIRRSKRCKRSSLMMTDTYMLRPTRNDFAEDSEEEDPHKEEENKDDSEIEHSSKRSNNPFLKSPDIGLRARAKFFGSPLNEENDKPARKKLPIISNSEDENDLKGNPVCLVEIEKNHIYDWDKNIVVKSRYFRPTESQESGISSEEHPQNTVDSQLSIYSVESVQLETQNINDMLDPCSPKSNISSSDSAYADGDHKIIREEPSNYKKNGVETVTLEDEEEEFSTSSAYFNGDNSPVSDAKVESRNGIKKSPRIASFGLKTKKTVYTPSAASKIAGKCRVQGLKRKQDSNQQTLLQMFGYQPK